jgi:hypothetical protein
MSELRVNRVVKGEGCVCARVCEWSELQIRRCCRLRRANMCVSVG